MPYFTTFNLKSSPARNIPGLPNRRGIPEVTKERKKELGKELEKMGVFESVSQNGGAAYAFQKWYEFDDDMLVLSSRFPEFFFTLYGEGDNGLSDLWCAYYYNGTSQMCDGKVVYEAFSPFKLEKPDVKFAKNYTYSYQKVGENDE